MDVKQISRALGFAGKAVTMAEKLLTMAAKAGIEAPKRKRRKRAKDAVMAPRAKRKRKVGPGAATEESE